MKKIKEDFLYYIWRTKQFSHHNLKTIDGQSIDIIDYGLLNHNSGPDFSNAVIKIGDTIWAGNVEMHIFSSDWENHRHQEDIAYENVILHVVYEHDRTITFNTSKPQLVIPTLEIKGYTKKELISTYSDLLESKSWIPCKEIITCSDIRKFQLWKYNLNTQRLWDKTASIEQLHLKKDYDWEETAYVLLSKYFGGTANKSPFEQLAINTPYQIIKKISDSQVHVEALLFGQAGFLTANYEDEYFQLLKNEYQHLRHKYKLKPMCVSTWKFSKMRPSGFPTIRIAQLAAVLSQNHNLMSNFIEIKHNNEVDQLFSFTPNEYWENHYRFNAPSKNHSVKITNGFIERIIINCIIPLKFLYGKKIDKPSLVDECTDLLESIPTETNSIINRWKDIGFEIQTALDSQALLQLKSQYCDLQKCMNCSIGHSIFSRP